MAVKDLEVVHVRTSGWVGWVYFAAFVLLISGILQIISGLVALLNSGYYAIDGETALIFDISTWGWIHLLLGIIAVCIGTALFSGRAWARVVAVVLASLNFIAYFTFVGVHPIWSVTVMVIDAFVIYALTVHGEEAARLAE